eukprot:scaffold14615_cov65-Cyclotella_meneghiniana.AAC.21
MILSLDERERNTARATLPAHPHPTTRNLKPTHHTPARSSATTNTTTPPPTSHLPPHHATTAHSPQAPGTSHVGLGGQEARPRIPPYRPPSYPPCFHHVRQFRAPLKPHGTRAEPRKITSYFVW